jgi:hypothetical protein
VLRETNHREHASAERDPIAEDKTGSAVGDYLIVAASNSATFDDYWRTAWSRRLVTDDVEPELVAHVLTLYRLIRDASGGVHARDAGDRLPRVSWNARYLREGTARTGFHNPQIDSRRSGDGQRLNDEPAIDADHCEHDSEQEAKSQAGQ